MEESKVCASYVALCKEIYVKDIHPLGSSPKEGPVA
jgi:hypothetical protein